jgi:hypothetical protein
LPNPASAHASTPGEIDAAFATLRQLPERINDVRFWK